MSVYYFGKRVFPEYTSWIFFRIISVKLFWIHCGRPRRLRWSVENSKRYFFFLSQKSIITYSTAQQSIHDSAYREVCQQTGGGLSSSSCLIRIHFIILSGYIYCLLTSYGSLLQAGCDLRNINKNIDILSIMQSMSPRYE